MAKLEVARISGIPLKLLVGMMRSGARSIATSVARGQLGIDRVLALGATARSALPVDNRPVQARPPRDRPSEDLGIPEGAAWQNTALSAQAAYARGDRTPRSVAERALESARELAARTPSMGPILDYDDAVALSAADESARRITDGTARPLEGVVTAVKEELDIAGLPTGLGTRFLTTVPATQDATAVKRLRQAGAIVLGSTPMTQFGMSPLGGNPHRVMPGNAHDPSCLAGGSSTGSAVAVATGVVPFALGLDGGGSIRIPACVNGVYGIKPTYGRVPTSGHGLSAGSSVVHAGPIGSTPHDLAVFLDALVGEDAADPASLGQPPPRPSQHVAALGRGVRGLVIGIDESEWEAADNEVAERGRTALRELERAGAVLRTVDIPLAEESSAIGYLSIGLESCEGLGALRATNFEDFEPYLQIFMLQFDGFGPLDYLAAQRLRASLRQQTAVALREVDVLALPTTNCSAPRVTPSQMRSGFVDPPALDAISRYSYLGNLTGLPAGTAPVGLDSRGLPLGLQIIADAWDEAAVLQVLAQLQRSGAAIVTRPASHVGAL